MPDFIKGLELNELFYAEIVAPILKSRFPELKYSSGLIGWGSEVLGYDDFQSTDHNWGLRFQLFLSKADCENYSDSINTVLIQELPTEFQGFPTVFEIHVNKDQRDEQRDVKHNIEIETIEAFFGRYLGCDPFDEIKATAWLTFPEHKLLAVTSGKIFDDGSGKLREIQQKFSYYPKDVWLYLLTCQWQKIFEEQAFVGRCGQVGDELGSRLIAARQVKKLMQLCFLIEQRYAPYSKWFGTAFSKLNYSEELKPIFEKILQANDWQERQDFLAQAYRSIIGKFNALEITTPISEDVSEYFGRPFLVIKDESIIENLKRAITDEEVKNICHNLGSINQLIDSNDQINDTDLCEKLKELYEPF